MTQDITPKKAQSWAIAIFQREDTLKKFQEVLWKRGTSFVTSMMTIVWQNDMLKEADPTSVYLSAMTAATLDLPINQNLGFAYILPYKDKNSWTVKAQFQMGYKGFIQLAQRSWQFKTISATPVYEGQLVEENPLTGYIFDWKGKTSDKIVGYAWYFSLINWFEKILYMTVDELQKHGARFSQSFRRWYWLWKDDFDAMAQKTVIKLLLSKYAPLSVDMQKAVISDQGIINDENLDNVEYADNPPLMEWEVVLNEEFLQDWQNQIDECKTLEDLEALQRQNKPTDPTILSLFDKKEYELKNI